MPDITLCADSYDCKDKATCRRSIHHYAQQKLRWQSQSYLYQRWKAEKTDECEYYEPMD